MRLEDIGFYTLSDERALRAGKGSPGPLERCEMIITSACNFKCPYCRHNDGMKGHAPAAEVLSTLTEWYRGGLRHVRFSGGEPTRHPSLRLFVEAARAFGVRRVAVSTNGSAPSSEYDTLITAGVDDFSVSLDACNAEEGDRISGRPGSWRQVVRNIERMAWRVYTTVGMVFTADTIDTVEESIRFAAHLGVADIRILSSAQYNETLGALDGIDDMLHRLPILRYRVERFRAGEPVRGLRPQDSDRCALVRDDMAVSGDRHYPCIIHLREGGLPIGHVGPGMSEARRVWARCHNTHEDPVCRKNCLDVCVQYNNTARAAP